MRETTALGAAIAAGFATDIWKTIDDLKDINTSGVTKFEPKMETQKAKKMFAKWEKAVQMCKGWDSD